MDRSVDLISPFCASQNYEGQLDETFGINTAYLKIANKILNPSSEALEASGLSEDALVDLKLTNEDFIFKEVRDISVSALGAVTTRKLNEIQNLIKRKEEKMTVNEMANYMTEIKQKNIVQSKQLIDYHVNIAMEIKSRQKSVDYNTCFQMEHMIITGDLPIKDIVLALEAKMVKKYDIYTISRLLTLLSTTNSGLKQAEFDHLRKTFIQCYGYQEISTMLNLQDTRLFKLKDKRFDWNKIKNELNLISENVRIDDPQSIHYVFGGMAPISVSLIERMCDVKGFLPMQKTLSLLPGRIMCPEAPVEKEFFQQSMRTKKILIYFLGGVTFAEIAAIRYLNKCPKFKDKVKFVIATTSIINGNKCIRQMQTASENHIDLTKILASK